MSNSNIIAEAAKIIQSGDIVIFPTETVYGIGADATSDSACRKIYDIKQRPNNNPLIVHVSSIKMAKEIAIFNADAELLSAKLWPGPLTLVLPLKPDSHIATNVTAGLKTIALRMPAHPIALKLIELVGKPIAAPSANPSGYISSTSEDHVRRHFKDALIISDESSANDTIGIESTILDLSQDTPTILRYGFITPELLGSLLQKNIIYGGHKSVKAPGMLAKHYSPKAVVRLNAQSLLDGESGIGFGDTDLQPLNLSPTGNLVEAARNLYAMLRLLDDMENTTTIAIAPIPDAGIGLAINDRIRRAASK